MCLAAGIAMVTVPIDVPPIRMALATVGLAREHWWRSVGMSGFARRRGSNIRRSSEHRATREPKAVACTLGTLKTDCGKAFSLLRFFVAEGPRNEVPPRTVANSDKKFSQHKTRANVCSNNPAPTPTPTPTTTQPRAKTPPEYERKYHEKPHPPANPGGNSPICRNTPSQSSRCHVFAMSPSRNS
jgi:hypothetical protein